MNSRSDVLYSYRIATSPKYVVDDRVVREEFNSLVDFIGSLVAEAREGNNRHATQAMEHVLKAVEDARKRVLLKSEIVSVN